MAYTFDGCGSGSGPDDRRYFVFYERHVAANRQSSRTEMDRCEDNQLLPAYLHSQIEMLLPSTAANFTSRTFSISL